MSRFYPPAVNASTALRLSNYASELDRTTLKALVSAVKRDQARLALVAQRTHQLQLLISLLGILNLYRACRITETVQWIKHDLGPLLDDSEMAALDELVRAYLFALPTRQERVYQDVVAWFYQKGELG